MKALAHQYLRPQQRVLPKFFRPKLTVDKRSACQIIIWDMVTNFANGSATQDELLDWIESGLTCAHMARLLKADGEVFTDAAMNILAELLDSHEALLARYRRHQPQPRIGFSEPELQTARDAAAVMVVLLEMDRHGIALRAAQWCARQMHVLRTTGQLAKYFF